MKPTLRRSQIHDYQKCAGCYECKWILGVKVLSNPKMALGTIVDAVQNHNLAQKINSGKDISVEEALDLCSQEAERVKYDTEFTLDETFEELKSTSLIITKFVIENVSPLIIPTAVQLNFQIETDLPFNISGTMDYIDIEGRVRDLKITSSRGLSWYPHEFNLQTAAYWFAQTALTGKEPKSFLFDCVLKPEGKKACSYKALEGIVSQESIEYFWNCATMAYEGIQKGVFMPSWAQNPMGCDGLCRARKMKKVG